jgi:hypothetical protein
MPDNNQNRTDHVARMLTNYRLEGIEPDETDVELLEAYMAGTVTLDDLLSYAGAYARYHERVQVSLKKLNLEYEAENESKEEKITSPEVTALVESFFRKNQE